jgi:hypothetical protein
MGHSLPWISLQQDFYELGLSTSLPTPELEDQASIFVTSGDRVTQLYPTYRVPILIALYDTHELRWNSSCPPVTTRRRQILLG